MKKILGGVGTAIVFAVVIGLKFASQSEEAAVATVSGEQWEDARADFLKEISSVIETDYDIFVLSQADRANIANCIVDKLIRFLNTTECSYVYNTATTTKETHLANQQKCMNDVKFAEHQNEFALECLKTEMPADWKVMKKIFAGWYEKAYIDQGMAPSEAKKIGECISNGLVALCDQRNYRLVDPSTRDAERLFFSVNRYIPEFEQDDGIMAIMEQCAPGGNAATIEAPIH